MILQIKLKVSIQKKKSTLGKLCAWRFPALSIQLNPVVSFPDAQNDDFEHLVGGFIPVEKY